MPPLHPEDTGSCHCSAIVNSMGGDEFLPMRKVILVKEVKVLTFTMPFKVLIDHQGSQRGTQLTMYKESQCARLSEELAIQVTFPVERILSELIDLEPHFCLLSVGKKTRRGDATARVAFRRFTLETTWQRHQSTIFHT